MAETPAFQSHHIIEQQAFRDNALLQQLSKDGLFNIDDAHNLLNMPADPELAAKMGVSPHNGAPLGEYSNRLMKELNRLEASPDGQAALAGDKAAAGRITERINNLRDTMRAGLINGDLFTNTPKDMPKDLVKAKTAEFFGDLDGYGQKHTDQIGKFSKVASNEWGLTTTSEERIKAALDALEQDGVKAAKGPAEAARNSLNIAIAQAREAGTLTLSEAFMKTLKDVSMKGLKGVAVAGVAADIALSTAEAKTLAEKGDVAGAHSVMNALGARLAFGWLGVEMGAPAGPYGAVLGGLAGLIGGEALVKGIEKIANQLTGLLNSNGTKTYEAKAPEATINPDGSTTITTFNPDNNKPSSNKTYDKQGRLTQSVTNYEDGAFYQADYQPDSNLGTTTPRWEHKFDAKGRILSAVSNTEDGARWETIYEPDSALGTSKPRWQNSYKNGRLITGSTNFDDGSILDGIYEPDSALGTSKARWENTYDAQRRLIKSVTNWDNGYRWQDIEVDKAAARYRVIDRLVESIPVEGGDGERIHEHAKEALTNVEIGPFMISGETDMAEYEKKLQQFLGAKAKEFGLNVTVGPVSVSSGNNQGNSTGETGGGEGGDRGDRGENDYGGNISIGDFSFPPVFLDLNRDGIIDPILLSSNKKKSESNSLKFDWTADGIPDQTAWVGPKDGMLVIDLAEDGSAGPDGKIDQPNEIAFALWKTEDERVAELKEKGIDDTGRPVTDLEGLRWAFDTNHDNILDSRDARWNEFRVWQDANQNGITDAGELMTMDQAGIRLINLMPSSDGSKAFPDGSAITGTSSAQMTDGTKMLVGDVSLAFRPSLSGSL